MTHADASRSAAPADAPVFRAPWEAQAFALVVHLHEQGAFDWQEWADHLSAQIHSGREASYYEHWLAALESLVADKGLTTPAALEARQRAWKDAAARTAHGDPITLE